MGNADVRRTTRGRLCRLAAGFVVVVASTVGLNMIGRDTKSGAGTEQPATVPTAIAQRAERVPDEGPLPAALGRTVMLGTVHNTEVYRPLTVSAAGTTVTSNLAAGGATWEWTDPTGTQYLNHYDMGREMQASFFVRSSDGRKLNPTEAGDRYGDPTFAPELRHMAPVALGEVTGNRQSTLSVPLEWSPPRLDPAVGNRHPILYPDVRLGKNLELAYAGMPTVARYDTILTLPAPAVDGDLEAPTAYLRGAFSQIFGYDAVTSRLALLTPPPFSKHGLDWTPPSGFGAVIASNALGNHAFAIYGATTDRGGSISHFTVNDFHVAGRPNGADDVNTVKLRALRVGDFAAGTTTTRTYIVTGSLATVQAEIARLARDGLT